MNRCWRAGRALVLSLVVATAVTGWQARDRAETELRTQRDANRAVAAEIARGDHEVAVVHSDTAGAVADRERASAQTETARVETVTLGREESALVAQLAELRQQVQDHQVGLATTQQLTSENQAQELALAECKQRLDGSRDALEEGRTAEARQELGSGVGSCRSALSGSSAAYPFDFPDPGVLVDGGTSFAFATNGIGGAVQALRSDDLQSWQLVGEALAGQPMWAVPGNTWAPAVVRLGDRFLLYFATRERETGRQCVSVAEAVVPEGPYRDTTLGPLVCDPGGSIDPSVFVAPDGRPYLLWKREIDHPGGPTGLWSQELAPDGRTLVGDPVRLLSSDRSWETGVVEAPSMVAIGGRFALLYSGSRWTTRDYAEGYAWCEGPRGPCAKPGMNDANVVLRSEGDREGPGGADAFRVADGSVRVAFHAWRAGLVGFPNPRVLYGGTVSVAADGALQIW